MSNHQGRNTLFCIIIVVVVESSYHCLLNNEGLGDSYPVTVPCMTWFDTTYDAIPHSGVYPAKCSLPRLGSVVYHSHVKCHDWCVAMNPSDLASEKGLEVSLKHWGHVRSSSMMRCFQSLLYMVHWNFTILLHTENRASCYHIYIAEQTACVFSKVTSRSKDHSVVSSPCLG